MKKTPILILICILIAGCSSTPKDPYLTKEDIIIDKILDTYSKWVEEKYSIYPIGTTIGMPNGELNLVGVHFQAYRIISKKEAREIIVNSSQKLLFMINSNAQLQNCLVTRPFEIKNINMKIFIVNANGNDTIYDPLIGAVRFSKGYLEYLTFNQVDDIPNIVSRSKESYEEAIETLENQ